MVNNGERGIVTSMTPGKLHQPVVTLIQDPDGKSYTPPIAVDLSDEAEEAADRLIVSILDAEKESTRHPALGTSRREPKDGRRTGMGILADDLTGVRLLRNANPVPNRVERHLGNDVLRHQLPLNPVGPILDHFISYFFRQA